MRKRLFCVSLIAGLLCFSFAESANVGLVVVATKKYIKFVGPLITSAEKHFCKNHKVTYFIFTDQEERPISLPNTVYVFHPHSDWPYSTMNRYYAYSNNWAVLRDQDYIFALDADMLFVGKVGDEILGERVATIHPGYINKRGTYETNKASKAYVGPREGERYYAGGFYGGSKEWFLDIITTNIRNIEDDKSRGVVALWHDESHWNRYCIDRKPTVVLSPSYCYPESWSLKYEKKILALDKNHAEMRKP